MQRENGLGYAARVRKATATVAAVALAGGGLALGGVAMAPAAGAATCISAGATGLTAAVIATAGQTISGTIDASGCNVGVYVPKAATFVTIDGATITNAADHAILAIGTNNLTVENSTIANNGANPTPNLGEDKAVQLDGVSNSTVTNNTLTGNVADGGISIADTGPFEPGSPGAGPSSQIPSTNDTVSNNTVKGNLGGCGVVIATFNPGLGVSNITVSGNTILGAVGKFPPVIGQIVIANDGPNSSIDHVTVTGNTISQSFLTGLVVHANAPGDVISNTVISGNTLSLDNWGGVNGAPVPSAIGLFAEQGPPGAVPMITGTTITGNAITQEQIAIWIGGQVVQTNISGNNISVFPGGLPVWTRPTPGGGYIVASSTGGVSTFGNAVSFGSVSNPSAPVVGAALTRDDAGYWLASADGNVYSFGDGNAMFHGQPYGSLVTQHVHPAKPIVAMAATPQAPEAGGPGGGPPATAGEGYWLVASDGGVFNFGDAPFKGSAGALKLAAPIVGMAPTADGEGYWLVASDGGVFNYGDAPFFGSMGGKHLNRPIAGIAPSPDGGGYTLIAADGGVFSFGDAPFVGSLPGIHVTPAAPIVSLAVSPFGPGYWMVAADGGVFNFGAAGFFGSAVGKLPTGSVKAISHT